MTLRRRYLTCRRCAQHAHPLDERLGVDGLVSPHAQRLLCAAGAEQSFERAARLLRELAGLQVCDNTVRRVCDEHGGRMRAWQREDPKAGQPFRAAEGEVEFQTDGTCVNTMGGWREVRLSIFAKRPRGEPVTDLDVWDRARLPMPTARVATAAIRTSAALGPQWRRGSGEAGHQAVGRADGAGRRRPMDLGRTGEEPARRRRGPGCLPRLRAPARGGGSPRGRRRDDRGLVPGAAADAAGVWGGGAAGGAGRTG